MALATNTTLGTIVLAGDLYGSDPTNPSLAPSGVTPGQSTFYYSMVVDTKGRTVHFADYPQSTPEDMENIRNEFGTYGGGAATTSTKGIVQIGSGLSVTNGVVSYSSPDATTSTKGLIQAGSGLSVTNGTISIPDATTSTKGIVQIGSGLSVTNGTISIPDATTTTKGIVQIGSGLSVTNGIISVPDATTSTKGIVQIGSGLSITNGTISIPDATTTTKGIVQIGSGLSVTNGTVSVPIASTTNYGIIGPNNPALSGLEIDVNGNIYASINDASTIVKGLVQIGSGLSVTDGILSIIDATDISKGIVQVDTTNLGTSGLPMRLNISNGSLSATLNYATPTNLGVCKVLSTGGLNVTNGYLTSPYWATSTSKGPVQIDTTNGAFSIIDGILIPNNATDTTKGFISVSTANGLSISDGVLSFHSIDFPSATGSSRGIASVQIGTGLSVTSGVVSFSGTAFNTLASHSTFGIVKPAVGQSIITVTADGTLKSSWRGSGTQITGNFTSTLNDGNNYFIAKTNEAFPISKYKFSTISDLNVLGDNKIHYCDYVFTYNSAQNNQICEYDYTGVTPNINSTYDHPILCKYDIDNSIIPRVFDIHASSCVRVKKNLLILKFTVNGISKTFKLDASRTPSHTFT